MKKAILLLLLMSGTLSFQSCTTDSIQDLEAEMEVYSTDNKSNPKKPKELPDEEDEG